MDYSRKLLSTVAFLAIASSVMAETITVDFPPFKSVCDYVSQIGRGRTGYITYNEQTFRVSTPTERNGVDADWAGNIQGIVDKDGSMKPGFIYYDYANMISVFPDSFSSDTMTCTWTPAPVVVDGPYFKYVLFKGRDAANYQMVFTSKPVASSSSSSSSSMPPVVTSDASELHEKINEACLTDLAEGNKSIVLAKGIMAHAASMTADEIKKLRVKTFDSPKQMNKMRKWANATRGYGLCSSSLSSEYTHKYHNRTELWPSLMANKTWAVISMREEQAAWQAAIERWQAQYIEGMASGFGKKWLKFHKDMNLAD